MRKLCLKLIALAMSVLVITVTIFGIVYFGISGVYENSYQKGYVYQYRALQRADPDVNKIVVIGGSYMTFATDSQRLKELTGMPVYTLGIHSGMGMDYIIETAKEFVKAGDILVFSFFPYEAHEYGMDLIHLTLDDEDDMFWDFFHKHPLEVIRTAGSAVYTKLYNMLKVDEWLRKVAVAIQESKPIGEEGFTVYDARAFDRETGNMTYPRGECEARDDLLYYSNVLTIDDVSDGCVEETISLSKFCSDNGVQFYMLYSPFYPGYYNFPSDSDVADFGKALEEKLGEKFIVDINRCVVPIEFVYNGARHLNDAGMDYYTNLIYEGLSKHVSFSTDKPAMNDSI